MWGRLIAIASALQLVGCTANDASIFRNVDIDGTEATVVDAKQRMLITVVTEDGVKFCAEPSPDALSAISSSLSTSLSVGVFGQGEGAASVAGSLQEAASEIGKRNATVQLFRDGWYRLCEGALNGDIGQSTYALLATKYADSTVVSLAIEELSGLTASTTTASGEEGTEADTDARVGSGPDTPSPENSSQNQEQNPDEAPAPEAENEEEAAAPGADGDEDPQGLLHFAGLLAQADPGADGAAETDTADEPGEAETDENASTSGSTSAGAPVVAPKNPSGRAPNPSDTVAKASALMVSEYLHRARFNDCLLALDRINIDLGTEGYEPNVAMTAIVESCAEVIKNQAEPNRMLVELLAGAVSGTMPE